MLSRRQITCDVMVVLLLFGLIASCTPTQLREFKGSLGPGEEMVTLDTRPGVTLRIFLVTPKTVPKGIFVLFPGGSGRLVSRRGQIGQGFGRSSSRLFADHGFIAAGVDVPSDQAGGLSIDFRYSKGHTEDAKKVIGFLSH